MKNKSFFFLITFLIFGCSKTETPAPIDPLSSATFTSMDKTSGVSGDVIVLSGKGFSTNVNENQVNFAGATINATIKTATANTLTVEVPQGTITGVISVKINNSVAKLAEGFSGVFTIVPVTTTPSGNATLTLNDKLKTFLDFAANDGLGNFFTINTVGYSHELYKVLRIDANGTITKTFEPTDFGGTAGTPLRINGITNDFEGNVYVAVGLSTFTYTKANGRLYVINKGKDQPVFVMDLISKDVPNLDVSNYFDDMVINSKKELFVSDLTKMYHVSTTGVFTPYIAGASALQSSQLLLFPGLTIDKNDNLYFTAVNDAGFVNNIYKADPAKNLTRLYNASEFGFADGASSIARFGVLTYLAVDAAGTQLYLSDMRQFRLRKLDLTTNMVTTVAGNGKNLGFALINGALVSTASGPALESTTQPIKLSLNEKQKTIYLQNPNDSYFQLFKY